MDFRTGSGGGSGDEQEASNTRKGRKSYHRHTAQQIEQLETFFKECPHPDENQRCQLSRDLGLEVKQIKFWFQNKRTQTKAQTERADNTILRAENERIQCENLAIREALKNVICPACGGPPFGEEERQRSLQKLQLENAQLKDEAMGNVLQHEKVSSLLAQYIGKPISQIQTPTPVPRSSLDISPGTPLNQRLGTSAVDIDFSSSPAISSNTAFPFQFKGIPNMEKALMLETAVNALDEVTRLLRLNEPLWIKASGDERYFLHQDSYEKLFPRANRFKNSGARTESSKDSGIVTMSGVHLVEMILDSEKWVDLFPTIVTKAKTIHALETGILGNWSGSLQLMHEQMHILSPLVPPREFYFLRHCQQIELGVWVIVDVSYDLSKENISPSRSWRLPSGCMIQDMLNGCSKVTWVEHVEVDDKTQTHRLFRDLICSSSTAYGAQRWIVTLKRMCERFAYSMAENTPSRELVGVFSLPEGRRNIMTLSHRMVKDFCGTLSMSGKLDFPHLSEVHNSGVRIAVRHSTEPGQPSGMIVNAATSLWLPLPPENVFDFFRDEKTRVQWDVLSNGNPVQEIAHISNGAHPGNCISIIRPFIPRENNILMLQESCIDTLGSLVVYAPIDIPSINAAMSGEDSSNLPILPSGFVISGDGRPDVGTGASTSRNSGRSRGSLLTVAFQILVSSPSSSKQLNMDSVATVNSLISSIVQRIKAALNCSGLE
ncbi:Homeobox-leucine zipper protein ROC8 [Morella rubra]|uniref:Homeobox-leucine zipper protein ROC8 n=1 Tax=Morella rubra TaxID=262757 RepID=A0A6A1VER8_9ROSI|nr:Homeobox-leucine zipper protein ROC8 [Morella rubra]